MRFMIPVIMRKSTMDSFNKLLMIALRDAYRRGLSDVDSAALDRWPKSWGSTFGMMSCVSGARFALRNLRNVLNRTVLGVRQPTDVGEVW